MADTETKPNEPNATPEKVEELIKDEQPVVKAEEPAATDVPAKTDAPVVEESKPETEAEAETETGATAATSSEPPAKTESLETGPAKLEDPAPKDSPKPEAAAAPVPANTEEPTKQETTVVEPAKAEAEAEAKTEPETTQTEKTAAAAATTTTAVADTENPKVDEPIQELYKVAKANGHPEIWGVILQDPEHHVPSQIVFQKYLNANDGDLAKAKDQLLKTLEWRAQNSPLEMVTKTWSKDKFDGLGYVTTYGDASQGAEGKEVFTWNIYGIVKDMDKTFGDRDEFINWRVALMELAMKELDISSATQPITTSWDPYKIYQVHDYKSVSFLRQHPKVKAAVKETVKVFGQNYPELLKQKFFVNVPAIMGWLYSVVKLFVAERTAKKFHPMGNGANMSAEFAASKVPALGEKLPKEYGGKGDELKTQGKQTLLD